MKKMFSNCLSLTSLDLSGFNTNNVEKMSYMFQNCSKLISLNLSNFLIPKVTELDYIFSYNENLISLDISNFNTSNCNTFTNAFEECRQLTVTLNGRKCAKLLSSIPDYVKIKYID